MNSGLSLKGRSELIVTIAYVVLKLFTGRVREVRSGMWILAFLSCTFYLFYPYH